MNNIKNNKDNQHEKPRKRTRLFRISLRDAWLVLIFQPVLFVVSNAIFYSALINNDISFFEWVKITYNFNTILFALFMFVAGLLVLYVYFMYKGSRLLKWGGLASVIMACLFYGLRIYATHIEPHNLQLETITIYSDEIVQPVKMLHLSDIQADSVGRYEESVFAWIQNIQPDLVVHTGDLLHPIPPATYVSELEKIVQLFRSLDCPLGIYGVYGNTDEKLHHYSLDKLGGLQMLENEEEIVSASGTHLSLFGLSLNQSENLDIQVVENWLEGTKPDEFTILLGHIPDYILSVKHLDIDLCLAGHTHGGQVVIPFYGPILVASNIPKDWASGFRKAGQTHLNVSAGIGCEHDQQLMDLRFNCPPAMTLFELLPEKKKD